MKTVIALGGEIPSVELIQHSCTQCSTIIAADSGLDYLLPYGITPHLHIGDFDSTQSTLKKRDYQVIHDPDQNQSDFEKALQHIPKHTQQILILGGTGKRHDHFVNNLLIASQIAPNIDVTFLTQQGPLTRVTPIRTFRFPSSPQQIISLLPISSAKQVTTTGLKWNLCQQDMGPGQQLGLSNVALENTFTIEITSGQLFVALLEPSYLESSPTTPIKQAASVDAT